MITLITLTPRLSAGSRSWQSLLLLILVGLVTACDMVDYSLNTENFVSAPRSRDIGTIYFHYADDATPYAVQVNRIRRGYAIQAPLYGNDEDTHTDFVISHTKDYQSFVGIETHYTF